MITNLLKYIIPFPLSPDRGTGHQGRTEGLPAGGELPGPAQDGTALHRTGESIYTRRRRVGY